MSKTIKAECGNCRKLAEYEDIEKQYCVYCGFKKLHPVHVEKSIAARLQYLDRLLDIARLNDVTGVLRNELAKRMAPVCDSIEKDLGLSDKFNVGDLTVKLNVDTSEFVEKMKNIADEIKKVGGTINVGNKGTLIWIWGE